MNVSDLRKDFETGVDDVGKFAREVVAKRVAIVAALTILVNLAVSYGWVTPDISDSVTRWIEVVFDVAGAVAAIAVIRPAVTPVTDPRDTTGEKLVPVSDALAVVEKTVNEVKDAYGDVRAGNYGNAIGVLADVKDAADELVKDVKTDAAAITSAVQHPSNQGPVTPGQ